MVDVVVVGLAGSSAPSAGAVVEEPSGGVVEGVVVEVAEPSGARWGGRVDGGVVSMARGSVVVVLGSVSGGAVVTGTRAAGTSSVGGGGSGRTAR